MFQKASRFKIRFDTPKGQLSVEDLWDLPLTSAVAGKPNLDDVARSLFLQLKSGNDVSFVNTEKKSDEIVQLKFDLVKSIIDTRLAENAAAAAAKANRDQKQKLLEIIANKQDQALLNMPLEELQKMVQGL